MQGGANLSGIIPGGGTGGGGGGGTVYIVNAQNGVSLLPPGNPTTTPIVVFGNDYALPTANQIAQLTSNREVFLNQHNIFWSCDNVSVADGGRSIVYITGIYLDENSSSPLFTENGAMYYGIADAGTSSTWQTQRRQDNSGFFTGAESGALSIGWNGLTWYDATGNIQLGYMSNVNTDNANNIFFYIYGDSTGRGNMGIKTVNAVGSNPTYPLVWDTVTNEVLRGAPYLNNADNGLSIDTTIPTTPYIQLGGNLIKNTTVNGGADYTMVFESSLTGAFTLTGSNSSSGSGVLGSSVSGVGIYGLASGTGTGIYAQSQGGIGLQASSILDIAAQLQIVPASTNTAPTIVAVGRGSSGTVTNNVGGAIEYDIQLSNGGLYPCSLLISRWTNATIGSQTSQFEVWGINNNSSMSQLLTLKGTGQLQLNKYGAGTFSGTPTYALAVDASGDIIEIAL